MIELDYNLKVHDSAGKVTRLVCDTEKKLKKETDTKIKYVFNEVNKVKELGRKLKALENLHGHTEDDVTQLKWKLDIHSTQVPELVKNDIANRNIIQKLLNDINCMVSLDAFDKRFLEVMVVTEVKLRT